MSTLHGGKQERAHIKVTDTRPESQNDWNADGILVQHLHDQCVLRIISTRQMVIQL